MGMVLKWFCRVFDKQESSRNRGGGLHGYVFNIGAPAFRSGMKAFQVLLVLHLKRAVPIIWWRLFSESSTTFPIHL